MLKKRLKLSKRFRPNKRFRRDYDKLFRRDPISANLLLLMCEIADRRGLVMVRDENEIADLMAARFPDPEAYMLKGGR